MLRRTIRFNVTIHIVYHITPLQRVFFKWFVITDKQNPPHLIQIVSMTRSYLSSSLIIFFMQEVFFYKLYK